MSHLSTGQRDQGVSEQSHFCPSRGERDPSKIQLGTGASSSLWFPSLSSAADPCFVLLGFFAIVENFFLWQLVHAQGREKGGTGASSPSRGSQMWSQVGHKSLISRANVPLCRLIPSFSLKSLKISKENPEKTLRKP